MRWFAHSRDGHPEEQWETQAEHGGAVGQAAGTRAQKFGCGDVGRAAGVLHDLGKYTPQFQDYIRGKAKSLDHSTAGAVHARDVFTGPLGKLIAHCIAGHHTGLKDGLLAKEGRLDSYAAKLPPIVAAGKADGFAFPAAPTFGAMVTDPAEQGFQLACLIRMLFSCLVDADRTETARFYGTLPEAAPVVTMADLARELHRSTREQSETRQRDGTAATPVNRLRARVHDHVAAQAGAKPDVFTLTVPTGGGKTLTLMRFALDHAVANTLDRVIVVIPFTSVIEQSADVYRDALGRFADQILEHHSGFEDDEAEAREDRTDGVQTKLRLVTETWAAPLIVTTAVQFFESLFGAKTSRCRKLHNIARSVIVLDEAQTIPLHLLRPCVAMLKELQRNYGCSIVLCTATQPALDDNGGPNSFAGGFVAPKELAPDCEALFRDLERVTIRSIGLQDDAALASRMEASHQALCIVNSRKHARDLFEAIRHLPDARHLSTLMLPEHRRRVLDEIKADLKAGKPCRVVSTSLVEAGVDFSFPLVLRAEAGLEQIVQAAGRCNRNDELGEGRRGEALVFEADGHRPLQAMIPNVEVAREILRHHVNPQLPEAIQAYFKALYRRLSLEGLDRSGVIETCRGKDRTLDFPFESIAKAMRLIDDVMTPIIVPLDEEAREAVERLRHVDKPGRLARILQRHSVGIPPAALSRLLGEGVAEVIRPDIFANQFVVLTNLDLYDQKVGLTWDDPTYVESLRIPT